MVACDAVRICLFYGLIYSSPCLWLIEFAANTRKALRSRETMLANSFRSFGKYWRYMGVLTILGIGFIFILFAVVFLRIT